MKVKKVLKGTGIAFLILLVLLVLVLLGMSAFYHIRLHRIENALKESGYYHPVSVGERSLNLYECGNGNGAHTVIALAGLFDGEMSIGWRQMTAALEQENRLVFIDRAGYGFSDDTDSEMTAENVVADYRKALQNEGISAPYLLIAHSLGGAYATYWESTYPDEVEAVIFVDGSICEPIPAEEQHYDATSVKAMDFLEKAGLMPFVVRSLYGRFLDNLPAEQVQQALYLMCKTAGSDAVGSEQVLDSRNCNAVWEQMAPNDIPKLYITATLGYHTKGDFIQDGVPAESLLYYYVDGSYANAGDDAIYEQALAVMDDIRQNRFLPYMEKLGNCTVAELPGDHVIFLEKPEQCSKHIMDFTDELDSE